MTKEFGKTALVAVMVLAFAVAPFAGALCTMSCADGGGSCCCTAGVPGELSLEKPSCCEGEVKRSSGTGIDGVMAAGSCGTVFTSMDVSRGERVAFLYGERPTGFAVPLDEGDTARSSPIFLLTESFLI